MTKTEPDSGCYQLVIEVSDDIEVRVGALGTFFFSRGKYVYTGSAMKNLTARVTRHLAADKKLRWHIDYLLAGREVSIVDVRRFPSVFREECVYNRAALNDGGTIPVPRFGSSDCRECVSHLVRMSDDPSFDETNRKPSSAASLKLSPKAH